LEVIIIKAKTIKEKELESIESELDEKVIDQVITEFRGKPGELLLILENVQKLNHYNYLPMNTIKYIYENLGIHPAKVFSVVTFFSFFNLIPEGEHCITICRGTACHTKRSRILLDYVIDYLNIEEELNENEKVFITTPDRMFTVRTIACFGQCALSPVIELDGEIHAHMNTEKLRVLIDKIKEEEKKKKKEMKKKEMISDAN
jgi:NADH-quinone oxidoreductase subunit E